MCIVSDGRSKINPRTRSVLAALGVYQDGVGKNMVNGKPVVGSVQSAWFAHFVDCPPVRVHYTT